MVYEEPTLLHLLGIICTLKFTEILQVIVHRNIANRKHMHRQVIFMSGLYHEGFRKNKQQVNR